MNQLDMLELAARAAGWESKRHTVRDLTAVHVRPCIESAWRAFDPLGSRADAFELSTAARIDVTHFADYVAAHAGAGAFRHFTHDDIDACTSVIAQLSERERATRRAITECAALIGRDVGAPWWRTV
ncbi:hypothetical protein WI73_04730 [Burkholderia ubonensis]|uniref:hypothetical protein n=1 Tax=Burkholderia ubonensis TaxID=101571 RepID=UPI000756E189|nr:hypothetical protein [Burkholderia ubonensis]KVC60528.1 hypothetical protein WI73_04730 [Burkholderia ubonensis]